MVKAFMVYFKQLMAYGFSNGFGTTTSTATFSGYGQNQYKPIVVIANTIADVANKYPEAEQIVEIESKEVIILDKIICPVNK